ncbi:hypothetical protein ACA910_014388 [Epithemia clementina (nom. ined.)]
MNASVNSDPGHPNDLKAALRSDKAAEWKSGLFSEYDNFMKRNAWEIKIRPKNARVLKTKNVFKTKLLAITKEIRHKVRNCVKGYEQIPGVDYTESYAAVASDGTIRTMLGVSLYNKSRRRNRVLAKLFDVEAAFLNAPLMETVYIELPELFHEYCESQGIELPEGDLVIQLKMGQYGLVQVARAWVKRMTQILIDPELGLQQCKSDPCLFVKHNEKGELILYVVTYIDDALYGGEQEETTKLLLFIQSKVTITDIGDIDIYLGVKYEYWEDKDGPYFECSMPKYIDSMVTEFEEFVRQYSPTFKLKDYPTPAPQGQNLTKNEDDCKLNHRNTGDSSEKLYLPSKRCYPIALMQLESKPCT